MKFRRLIGEFSRDGQLMFRAGREIDLSRQEVASSGERRRNLARTLRTAMQRLTRQSGGNSGIRPMKVAIYTVSWTIFGLIGLETALAGNFAGWFCVLAAGVDRGHVLLEVSL